MTKSVFWYTYCEIIKMMVYQYGFGGQGNEN